MTLRLVLNTGWVETDGSYGVSDVILFDQNDLTDSQWETLVNLHEGERISYVEAIMNGEPLDEWEESHD
jgi:hypothetical protein